MSLLHVPLDQITAGHLQGLIDAGAPEALTIEYKQESYGNNGDAHAEFLADISSFANTRGGDLILRVQAEKGIPVAFMPLALDIDGERLRLDGAHRLRAVFPIVARVRLQRRWRQPIAAGCLLSTVSGRSSLPLRAKSQTMALAEPAECRPYFLKRASN
jgi:hypothetical protein